MKSIRVKLWLGMMILVGINIILLWLFQIVFLGKFYTTLEVREVTKKADNIAARIGRLEDADQINEITEITKAMEDFIYQKQLSVQVIDTSYQVVYQGSAGNSTNTPGVMKKVVESVSENALKGLKSKQQMVHPKFRNEIMFIGIPIYKKAVIQGAMIITLPMASVEDTADILKKQLFIITGILLLISFFISFRLSKNLADPISKISRQAESYAVGHYLTRNNNAGEDEIGKLSKRMNDMGEALARNDMLQKELIANVSHELRTPLALVRGYAETLRDVTGDNAEKRQKQLGIIIEETKRLGIIVEDILSLSQLQSGTAVLEKVPFSLKEMIYNIKEHFDIQQGERTFQIIGISEVDGNVLADKKRIAQVFYNLINNAFLHTNKEASVEVVVMQKLDQVIIDVTDHGEGIAKEDLDHIFERYYKGKQEDGRKSNGTGLGLAIVKSILDMHQVSYGVKSELGEGTTFWFTLERDNSHTSF